MTIYYNPKAPILYCLTDVKRWRFTCMYTVMVQRWEFWFFVLLHSALALLTSTQILDVSDMGEPPASAQALVQFFMTFFITFYNRHCFSRYNKLYDECMQILDGAIFFVYEMTVSLGHLQLESHRVQATKYILATIYTFFMGLTGGELTPKEWHECERKGLLTKAETEALAEYPGHSYTLVLSTWAMQVIDDALENDCVWTKRSQRIAHLHNRLNNNIIGMLSACHTVGHIIACPIPFPYYHLMNLVLVLNFILVACVLALLQSLFTIIPYMVVVLIFLGLREVATQLADPFGDDAVDFPVAEFLNYVTDQIVCLLETFNRMDMSMLREAIEKEKGFTSAQLLRQVDKQQLYKVSGINFLDSSFNWHKAKALEKFDEDENPVSRLRAMFKNPQETNASEFLEHAGDQGLTEEDVSLQLQHLHSRIVSGEAELKGLQAQIAELEAARTQPDGVDLLEAPQPPPSRGGSSATASETQAQTQVTAQEDSRPSHHQHHHHNVDYEDHLHDDVSEGSVRSVRYRHRQSPRAVESQQQQQQQQPTQQQQQPPPQQQQPPPQQQQQQQPPTPQTNGSGLMPEQEATADFASMSSHIQNIKASARNGSGTPVLSSTSGIGSFEEARRKLQRYGHGGPPDEADLAATTASPSQAPGAVLMGRPLVPTSNGSTPLHASPLSGRGASGKTASRSSSREAPPMANGSNEALTNGFADARAEIRRALEASQSRDSSRDKRRSSPAGSEASSTRRRKSRG